MAGRSDIQAGRASIELVVKNSQFVKSLEGARRQLQGFGKAVSIAGATVAAAGAAIIAPFTAAVMHFAASGKELQMMSLRTSVSAQALSELGFAARRSGVDLEAVEHGFKHMEKTIGGAIQGSSEAADALGRVGL